MTRIVVSRAMPVPRAAAWEAIADLASHPRWMRDAHSIKFTTDQHRGVGTRVEVETRVGPLRTVDVMEVTAWDEGHSIAVTHRGVIRGVGRLSIGEVSDAAIVTWTEDLTFPWWLGAGLTARLARPILARVWRGNLERLEESLTSP